VTRRVQRLFVITALGAVWIALALNLVLPQVAVLTAWQAWHISAQGADAPAACELAGYLRMFGAARLSGTTAISPEAALDSLQTAISAQISPVTLGAHSDPLAISMRGMPFYAITHEIGTVQRDLVTHATVMIGFVDAQNGAVASTFLVDGARLQNSACAFNWRNWAVDTVRSTPFALFAGYSGLMLGVIAISAFLWRRQAARSATSLPSAA
jgi:hypothetical protein